jgi:hypothetical protein
MKVAMEIFFLETRMRATNVRGHQFIPRPKRIFDLNRTDRMNRIGPADRLGVCLAQAEISDFAKLHKARHRADGVLYGNVRIAAMLVV